MDKGNLSYLLHSQETKQKRLREGISLLAAGELEPRRCRAAAARVFRGMYRNWMAWPDFAAEIVSASETSVTARFNRPYAAAFGEQRDLYGCTLEEFERVLELAHQGIADYLDLEYQQRREGESLMVTLRKKTEVSKSGARNAA